LFLCAAPRLPAGTAPGRGQARPVYFPSGNIKMILNQLQSKNNGICSICSAHDYVIKTACRKAVADGSRLLIESTSNQVDQFGGYTGMKPADFVKYVTDIALAEGLALNQLILGGDHLGPNAWQNEPAEMAMIKARNLIENYVKAGYLKIHLDTSMSCADDLGTPLAVDIIARRAADLCKVAEESADNVNKPVYVIGTDVPIPGGAQEDLADIRITPVAEIDETIRITKKAFHDYGLDEAWERVIAVVVQPGVEFGDSTVIEYDKAKAADMSKYIEKYDTMVYEAHSTDYQTRQALRQMVENYFAILKVGPWLTFAFREVVFALNAIEMELLALNKNVHLSGIVNTIENQMVKYPEYWQAHYKGKESELKLKRKFSYSDRIRYYWPNPEISQSLKRLIDNLSKYEIPLSLLNQFLPHQYEAVRESRLKNDVNSFIEYGIEKVLDIYKYATEKK
jgi:D-tagatose-1,6-bisphosphate aldolase subunit GatZ/KbaZ